MCLSQVHLLKQILSFSQWLTLWILEWDHADRKYQTSVPSSSDSTLCIFLSNFSALPAPRKSLAVLQPPTPRHLAGSHVPSLGHLIWVWGINWPVGDSGVCELIEVARRCQPPPRDSDAGLPVFVFLLIELLMPHLSTSLKQSLLDAFRNPSLCG
jgi:hypothetical protein